jgi:hypothetical protein
MLGIDIVKSSNMAELFALQDIRGENRPSSQEGEQEPKHVGIKPVVDKSMGAELIRRNGTWKLDLR